MVATVENELEVFHVTRAYRAVGEFLNDLMAPGASRPWQDVLQRTTGRALDAQAMVDYFQPLYEWADFALLIVGQNSQ